ncbi:MAG: DUF3380 domain-containing protein [Sphingomonadales bacterium]|nr:MAG: DUF3380 domain-containing protein [Sphingomonadales bacterium]
MNIIELQRAIGTKPDGIWGKNSRDALLNTFTNPAAPPLSAAQVKTFATRLGVSVKQLQAVASVESSGGGYDSKGRPKILFERHKFHKFTGGRFSVTPFSNATPGGYNENSWDKLVGAIVTGSVDAAFMSCSWGKFQVLGEYWDDFGFASPFALAHSLVANEAAHYEMLCMYVEHFRLQDEMAAISANADSCRAFAKAYNGANYMAIPPGYHVKIAKAFAAP